MISIESTAIQETEDYDTKTDNALEWLGDTSYLVLYHGVLYCWDINVQTVLFCNYILHYGNTSHLLSVRQFYKNQSIVFVVYQYYHSYIFLLLALLMKM